MRLNKRDLGLDKEPPKPTTVVQEHKIDEAKLVDKIVSQLNPKLSRLQNMLLSAQSTEDKESPKEWEHEIIRDDAGMIKKIISKQRIK